MNDRPVSSLCGTEYLTEGRNQIDLDAGRAGKGPVVLGQRPSQGQEIIPIGSRRDPNRVHSAGKQPSPEVVPIERPAVLDAGLEYGRGTCYPVRDPVECRGKGGVVAGVRPHLTNEVTEILLESFCGWPSWKIIHGWLNVGFGTRLVNLPTASFPVA